MHDGLLTCPLSSPDGSISRRCSCCSGPRSFGSAWRSEHSLPARSIAPGPSRDNHLLRIAAPVAAISGVAWLACILINMTSDFRSVVDPEDLRLFFFETPFGTVSILRLALLAIGVVIVFLPWHGRWRFSSLVPVGALLFSHPGLVWPCGRRRWAL